MNNDRLLQEQPPPRGCVLKLDDTNGGYVPAGAAASARLCVETVHCRQNLNKNKAQPPPRGCVLKQLHQLEAVKGSVQPPPRGCVLKPKCRDPRQAYGMQPPPRGCVLKHKSYY